MRQGSRTTRQPLDQFDEDEPHRNAHYRWGLGFVGLWQLSQRETVRETRLVKPATGARIRANRSYSRERSSRRASKSLYRRPHERAHVSRATQTFATALALRECSLSLSKDIYFVYWL